MTDVTVNAEDVRLAVSGKALSINSDSCTDSCIGYSEAEDDEPQLDPKHLNLVHEELEKLNIATDVINKLEVQLDGARAQFSAIVAVMISMKPFQSAEQFVPSLAAAGGYGANLGLGMGGGFPPMGGSSYGGGNGGYEGGARYGVQGGVGR